MKFKRLLSFAAACAMAVTSMIGTMSITASAEEGDVLQDEYWAYWDEGDHYRLSTYVGAASTGSDVVIPGYYNEKPVSAELTLSRDKVSVTYPDVPEVEPYTITPTYSSNSLTKNKTLTTVTVNHTGTVNMTMRYASVLENVYLYCSELILNSDFNNNNNDVAIYHVTNESVKNTLVAAGIPEANVLIDLQTSNVHDHGAVVATYEVGSSTASDVTATLYEDGCFIVSGTGAMKNYTSISLPWGTGSSGDSNINSIKNVVVEEGVTSVGNYAFRYAAALETVELAESVTTIGTYAFASCGTESTTYDFKGKISSLSASAFNTSTYGTVYVYDIDSYNTVSARAKSSMTVEFKGEIPTSGDAGETAAYTYDPDTSTLTISGTGTVDKKLSLYKNVKNIVIEDGITGIAASEFLGFTAEKIEIKGTISTVGSNAFNNVTAEINTYVPSTYKIIKELATAASSVNYLGTEPIPDPVVKVITDFTGDTTFIPGDGTIIGTNVPYLVVN